MNQGFALEKRGQDCLKAALTAPPITSTTFLISTAAQTARGEKLIYARQEYPGCYAAERSLSVLEHAEATLMFSSGMAAITTFFRTIQPGQAIVMPCELYWPHTIWVKEFAQSCGVELHWTEGLEVQDFLDKITPKTAMVWVEMLCNPSLRLIDVAGLAKALPEHVILGVNASCLSPSLARPLDLGADYVLHSASKVLGGHNDLMGGAISARVNSPHWQQVARGRWLSGNGLSSRDAACLNRSLETLHTRVERASVTALYIAQHMRSHRAVTRLNYIGLPDHPDHAKTKANLLGRGYGPLLGMELALSAEACQAVCEQTRIWSNVTGYGSSRSTIEHRGTSEYMTPQSQRNYLRLSAGLEPADDLIADLVQALDACSLRGTG